MAGRHEGKVAVIAGAARSMGQAIAEHFAGQGAKVAVLDVRDCTETGGKVRRAGGEFLGVSCDVTSADAVQGARDAIAAKFGGADILVNVVGILPNASFDDTDFALFQRVINVNLNSMFHTTKAFVPAMRSKGWGRIINFGSGIIHTTTPLHFAYRTSKAAIMGFTRSLAIDVAQYGITANTVSPSLVVTEATRESGAAASEPFVTQLQVNKRPAQIKDIVGLVSFLASDEAEFVTGQQMHADGGLVLL